MLEVLASHHPMHWTVAGQRDKRWINRANMIADDHRSLVLRQHNTTADLGSPAHLGHPDVEHIERELGGSKAIASIDGPDPYDERQRQKSQHTSGKASGGVVRQHSRYFQE